MNKITYYGSEKEIMAAVSALKKYERTHRKKPRLTVMKEAKARIIIQDLIDKYTLTAGIFVNGNSVWSKTRILNNLARISKQGYLYSIDQHNPPILSQYFYQFLSLICGTMAHGDINGWVQTYPTINHLKQIFKRNEFGKPVKAAIPPQWTDAKRIIDAIEAQLFPLDAFMKSQNNHNKNNHKP